MAGDKGPRSLLGFPCRPPPPAVTYRGCAATGSSSYRLLTQDTEQATARQVTYPPRACSYLPQHGPSYLPGPVFAQGPRSLLGTLRKRPTPARSYLPQAVWSPTRCPIGYLPKTPSKRSQPRVPHPTPIGYLPKSRIGDPIDDSCSCPLGYLPKA